MGLSFWVHATVIVNFSLAVIRSEAKVVYSIDRRCSQKVYFSVPFVTILFKSGTCGACIRVVLGINLGPAFSILWVENVLLDKREVQISNGIGESLGGRYLGS